MDESHPEATPTKLTEQEVDRRGDGFVLKADPAVRVNARAHKMSKSRGNVVRDASRPAPASRRRRAARPSLDARVVIATRCGFAWRGACRSTRTTWCGSLARIRCACTRCSWGRCGTPRWGESRRAGAQPPSFFCQAPDRSGLCVPAANAGVEHAGRGGRAPLPGESVARVRGRHQRRGAHARAAPDAPRVHQKGERAPPPFLPPFCRACDPGFSSSPALDLPSIVRSRSLRRRR